MAFATTSGIPDSFVIGDACSFTITDADHPANSSPAWTAKILFKDDATGTVKSFDATASGADHLFALTNANTGTLIEGDNLIAIVFSDSTHRVTTDWVNKTVLPDPTAVDSISDAQKVVNALQTAIQTMAGRTTGSVSVDGVTYSWTSPKMLSDLIVQWQAAVINEKRKRDSARGITTNRIVNVFTRN